MDFPQHILDKTLIPEDYLEWLQAETSIYAYLDLTNILHWQDTLGWKFRIEDLIGQLRSYQNVKEVKVYYGFNGRDEDNSRAFHNRIKKSGAILRAKPMKFIQKSIEGGMFFQRRTLTLFDGTVTGKINELATELRTSGIIIEEPKCNFDVEMAMDMLDDAEKMTAVLLYSGDSDLLGPLERLKVKGKRVGVVGVRGKVAAELHRVKDKYFDFGKLYTGKKTYVRRENPANGGTA
jgi:uncharacterized LabA/DUF88 family protein